MRHLSRLLLLAGALLVVRSAPVVVVLALVSPALAQEVPRELAVSPEDLAVSVPQGQRITVPLALSNAGSENQPTALSLAPADADPGDGTAPGDILFTSDTFFNLVDLAMAPGERIFGMGGSDTYEFTVSLDFVTEFEHPEVAFLSRTIGLAHRPSSNSDDEGALWWMDTRENSNDELQAVLLEGSLSGVATGRQLPVPFDADDAFCNRPSGQPGWLAFDSDDGGEDRFYNLDLFNDTVWAMDTLGVVAGGYPAVMSDYSRVPQPPFNPEGCLINAGLDAHTITVDDGLPPEPLLEVVTGYPFVHPRNRAYTAVVLDRQPGREGKNRGAETPLFTLLAPNGAGDARSLSGVVRSRLDPSVLYVSALSPGVVTEPNERIYAVRAAPLPPVWLRAEAVLDTVQAGSQTEALLTLDATGLAVGVYEGVVSVRLDNGIGPVVAEVPVTLTVTEGTDAEETAAPEESVDLTVYPNPARSRAQVALTLAKASDVRVAVYDVLGREVAVLHDGIAEAGPHRFTLVTAVLPTGTYLVRAGGESFHLTGRLTVVR